ncbi:MAG: glycoside hydrolase family 2 TIM barrel-domain containing protein [Verrucomicrobiota bacterium]
MFCLVVSPAFARETAIINPAWKFHLGEIPAAATGPDFNASSWEDVALPHTFKESTLGLDDNMDTKLQQTFHRTTGTYRKTLEIKSLPAGKRYFLVFQGAMQTLELWVNGKNIGKFQRTGYDTFSFEITSAVRVGENTVVAKVDNQINELTPPDGAKMAKDFVLFGGLYRDVEFVRTDATRITFPWEGKDAGVRVTFPEVSKEKSSVKIQTAVENGTAQESPVSIVTTLVDAAGKTVAKLESNAKIAAGASSLVTQDFNGIAGMKLWHPDTPNLYTARIVVMRDGKEIDSLEQRFGVRSLRFDAKQGFFINGEHLKLHGSNRHQTWPFIGNAVPNSLHRFDAEQIKKAGMNWVRLSHYPHDPDFLDACDELGLLLLEEGPTWMGTNGAPWIANLHESFRSMIRRDRNHPSIMTWNACVNHARFDRGLGKIVEQEDDRPIGAKFPATPMDFSHGNISGGGALTIEHTGHTFPHGRGETGKTGIDGEWELAKRHWEHVNASLAKPDNSGMAVWAMYDYNTFHNIDEKGIVWHGVADLTRIPKASYYWYQSELSKEPMVYIRPYMPGKAAVFSNCAKVELFDETGGASRALGEGKKPNGAVLAHPPLDFDIPANATALKAVGYRGGKPVANFIWRKAGLPAAVQLEVDAKSIVADGSDLTRVVATITDDKKAPVKNLASLVWFDVTGGGEIVGTNPAPIRAGKAVVLVRGGYKTGTLRITASSLGLKDDTASVSLRAPAKNVLMPKNPPTAKPVSKPAKPEGALLSAVQWSYQESQGQRWDRRFGFSNYDVIDLGGKTYRNVLVANAPAQVVYHLGGLYRELSVKLTAVDGTVSYHFMVDGKNILSKERLAADETVKIPLSGAQSLKLVALVDLPPGTKPQGRIHAIWQEGMLDYGKAPDAASRPFFDELGTANLAFKVPQAAAQPVEGGSPEQVEFSPVKDAKAGEWIESNIIMISGSSAKYPLTIEGGEYRIYSNPWTSKPGSAAPGDAVTVRVKAVAGETSAKVSIGGMKATFLVSGK